MDMRRILLSLLVTSLLASPYQDANARGSHHNRNHGYGGHHGHNNGASLAAGLIIGGVFGYVIHDSRLHYRSHHQRYYRPGHHSHSHSTAVYRRTQHALPPIKSNHNSEFTSSDCLMTREYTSTITIDGVDRDAYGTRCMTTDGSWVFGRPKLVPDL